MIVITGATGKTGSKIANLLLDKGNKIRVIGRSKEKLLPLQKRGAEITVGDQAEETFLTSALLNADALYLLIPPKMDATDLRTYYNHMGDVAVAAIKTSGIKKVVFLSSLGAELKRGTGPVVGLHDVEQKLNTLHTVDIAVLRPGYFMENILMNTPLILEKHINGGSAAPDTKMSMIATQDIAVKAAELLASRTFTGHTVIDLFGDRLSNRQVTAHLADAVGAGEIPYIQFSDKDSITSMMAMGLSESVASSYVELSHAFDENKVHPTTIDPRKPNTPTRFEQFAQEVFAPMYREAQKHEVLA